MKTVKSKVILSFFDIEEGRKILKNEIIERSIDRSKILDKHNLIEILEIK